MKLFYRCDEDNVPPSQHLSTSDLETLSAIEASEAADAWFMTTEDKGSYETDSSYVIVPDFKEKQT